MMKNDSYMSPLWGKTYMYHEYKPKTGMVEYTIYFRLPNDKYRVFYEDPLHGNLHEETPNPNMRIDVELPGLPDMFEKTEGLDEEMYLMGLMDGVVLAVVNDDAMRFYHIERKENGTD